MLYSFSDLDKKHFLWIDHQEFKHNNSEPNKTRLRLINYRESWKVISFQYIQLKPVQEIKQNGRKDLLYSSVEEIVAMPVYQTKTSQSCWSFVTHLKLYPSIKVNLWETLQITLYYVFEMYNPLTSIFSQVFWAFTNLRSLCTLLVFIVRSCALNVCSVPE